MAFPDLQTVLASWWGSSFEGAGFGAGIVITAEGNTYNANPAYGYADLLALYPKWFGTPVSMQLTTTLGSAVATLSAAITGLDEGDLLVLNGALSPNTIVLSVSGTSVTLSAVAIATVTAQAGLAFPTPLVPYVVIALYIALAQSSISQPLFQDSWKFGMALCIAHFLTLWAQSEGKPQTTLGQAAVAGLARGVAVSKSVDGVSVGYKPWTDGLEGWGAWQASSYGAQLITLARSVNFPMAYYQ